jgi:hypothetical protein
VATFDAWVKAADGTEDALQVYQRTIVRSGICRKTTLIGMSGAFGLSPIQVAR